MLLLLFGSWMSCKDPWKNSLYSQIQNTSMKLIYCFLLLFSFVYSFQNFYLTEKSEVSVHAEEEWKAVLKHPHLLQNKSIRQLQVLFYGTGCCPQQCCSNKLLILPQLCWALLALLLRAPASSCLLGILFSRFTFLYYLPIPDNHLQVCQMLVTTHAPLQEAPWILPSRFVGSHGMMKTWRCRVRDVSYDRCVGEERQQI